MDGFYKIVRMRQGKLFTLFHAIHGSKELPVGVWIEDQQRPSVRDGSGDRYYTSGIHVIKGEAALRRYVARFKRDDRVVVRCLAEGLRRKEHSPLPVYLADRILILPALDPIPVSQFQNLKTL